jgi:phosphate-selective porin OprO and OprP
MKIFRFVLTLLPFYILSPQVATFAQTEMDDRALVTFDKGLGFHAPDTSFGLYLRFRIQNRLGYTSISGNDLGIDEVEARIRRLRLRIDGYTVNSNITYYLQLSFSRSDLDWDNIQMPNIIRDAMIYYTFSDRFYIGFGQSKLPGNRQRINSSGQLQFTDRSIVSARFNIDRDFGVMSYYSGNISGIHYNLKTAFSTGDGRNALASASGFAYTGRFELLPLGSFKGNGDFSEGDLMREPSPRLSLAGGYHYNPGAIRAQGQRGQSLFEYRDLRTLFFDAMLKYRGWALASEYIDRYTDNPLTVSPDNEIAYVRTGYGVSTQLSYLFKSNIELAGRYAFVRPELISTEGYGQAGDLFINDPATGEYLLGITKYIMDHKIKAQGNVGYRTTATHPSYTGHRSNWVIQFQVELGI